MILLENGHWRSVRTEEEEQKSFTEKLEHLDPDVRSCVLTILEEYKTAGFSPIAQAACEEQWETVPVPIEQWLDDPNLSGESTASLHPALREDICELFKEPFFSTRYHEIIFTGALGIGKSFFASTCIMRICYEILCMKCPQTVLGLAPSEPLYIIPMSRTKELARRVAFGQIAGKLNLSPFFRERMRETKEEVVFPEKRLIIMGGASSESHALGMNVICAFIDEGNFFNNGGQKTQLAINKGEEEGYDKAQTIYEAMARRIRSRFKDANVSGMMFLVSSKRGVDDFTERRIKEIRKSGDPGAFVRDYASWEVRKSAYANSKWYRMAFNQTTGRSRYLLDTEEPFKDEIKIEFPEEFKPHFDMNPMGAAQDYGGISFAAADAFFSDREVIERAMRHNRHHPFTSHEWRTDEPLPIVWSEMVDVDLHGQLVPLCCPNAKRHVHIDLSKNRCATGFCVAHTCGVVEVMRVDPETKEPITEQAPVIHIDFILRIIAPPGGEIEHAEVRGLVFKLIENGINIRSVTMDRWCSTPNLQQFERAGLKASELSTVLKLDPYLYLLESMKENRVHIPEYDHLRWELRGLKPSADGKKIEKGQGVSKDLADALAAAVYYIAMNTTNYGPLAPQKGESQAQKPKGEWTKEGEYVWEDEKPNEEKDGPWSWM